MKALPATMVFLASLAACSLNDAAPSDANSADHGQDVVGTPDLEGFPTVAIRDCCLAHPDICRDYLELADSYSLSQCGDNSGCLRKPQPIGPQGCYCELCLDEKCLSALCID